MKKIFVANWKMELTYFESIALLDQKKDLEEINKITSEKNFQLIICPSYDVLSHAASQLTDFSHIKLGAQDCSQFKRGPFTGQVSALSLSEIGIQYCIVGHSERRALECETNEEVFAKAQQLIKSNLIPIICIGETEDERTQKLTFSVLEKQVQMCDYIYQKFCKQNGKKNILSTHLLVAYEPVWAIGTDKTPDEKELKEVLSWMRNKFGSNIPLLYGGSIDEKNIKKLACISDMDGFLIGRASCNIQKLKNMLSLV